LRSRSPQPAPLPAPGVHFASEYHRRIERLGARLSAIRERREGAGSAALAGAGQEFVGYRPYRPGEDLRMLDWSLFARLDRPFVRVTRREAFERWAVVVDGSASMGVGPPGKLQWAAEVGAALGVLALRAGATVEMTLTGPGMATFRARRHADFPGMLAFFEAHTAASTQGLAAWVEGCKLPPDIGRVFLIGDFVDFEPDCVRTLFRRGRELSLVQVLAPEELTPTRSGPVEWADPEGAQRVALVVDRGTRADYERALHGQLEALGAFALRHGLAYRCWSSARPFEDAVHDLVVPR
jgi:uncharacterized protein (DUF58 family)